MTPLQVKEINRIHAAVDDFASAMKTRLTRGVEMGYTGWDGEYPSGRLAGEIHADVQAALDGDGNRAADVANRAMMLWLRRANATHDGRAIDRTVDGIVGRGNGGEE